MKYDMTGKFIPPRHYPKVTLEAGAPPPQSFDASYALDSYTMDKHSSPVA
jgi:hypothetical protein